MLLDITTIFKHSFMWKNWLNMPLTFSSVLLLSILQMKFINFHLFHIYEKQFRLIWLDLVIPGMYWSLQSVRSWCNILLIFNLLELHHARMSWDHVELEINFLHDKTLATKIQVNKGDKGKVTPTWFSATLLLKLLLSVPDKHLKIS